MAEPAKKQADPNTTGVSNKLISGPTLASYQMPACRRQNAIQTNIMRFQGQIESDLAIERHAALEPWNSGQQPVEVSPATSQPTASEGEAYPRHQRQVQKLRIDLGTGESRLQNAGLPRFPRARGGLAW